MKVQDALKLTATAVEHLADALAEGKSEALKQYLAMQARFHRYSFGNVMLIISQKPDATQVAGFHTWRAMGRFVKKGEKGIVIIAPMLLRVREEAQSGELSDGAKRLLRFRAVYVFDVSQTDGEPLPEITRMSGDPREHTDRVKSLIAEKCITLEYADSLGGAEGVSIGGTIRIRAGQTPAEEFSTLVHELAHELMHRGEERPTTKLVRETEAEAVAFIVCHAIGLDTGTASSDYIALYQGDKDTLAASLDRIQKTAAEILQRVMEEDVAGNDDAHASTAASPNAQPAELEAERISEAA